MVVFANGARSNLQVVLDQLRERGYATRVETLLAMHQGLPQRRKRKYILALKPQPDHAVSTEEMLQRACDLITSIKLPYVAAARCSASVTKDAWVRELA